MSPTETTLIAGLAEILEADPATLTPETPLAAHGWDSVAVLSTIAFIDEQYGITVSGDELSRCATVRDISNLIAKS